MLSRLAVQNCRGFTNTAARAARFGGPSTSGSGASGFGSRFAQQTGFNLRSQAGPTLKERLLGPTTGKPYIYGTYALAGASLFGIGSLVYYGAGMSKESSILRDSAIWPSYVRERLSSTYSYLAASLGVTAASGVAASRSPTIMRLTSGGGLMAFAVTLGAIIATGYVARAIDYDNTLLKHSAWLVHAATMGAVLAPLCMLGGPILMRAAWYTAGVVAGLSSVAITAPSEKFLYMGGPLAMGFGVVFVANIAGLFFHPGTALGAGLASIVLYGGLILFSAFLLHDTQRVVKHAQAYPANGMYPGAYGMEQHNFKSFDPINAQMSIYMDVLNIFIRIAMIMGGMGGNRKK